MTWAVGEQSVAAAAFAGDDHPHLVRLRFSSSDASAQICTLTLQCEDGSSYELHFNRGGTLATAAKVEAPEVEPPLEERHAASHPSSGKRR
jgi:hypothetical protein